MKTRIITAIILIPIIFFIINSGGWYYRGFISAILSAASFEFMYSHRKQLGIINKTLTIIALIILVNSDYMNSFKTSITYFAAVCLFIITANFLLHPPKAFYEKTMLIFFTLIYLGIFGMHLNILYFRDYNEWLKIKFEANGKLLLIYAIVYTWVNDSGAYFIGKAIGKRKFAPQLSPNKTIEGLAGGFIFGIVYTLIFVSFAFKGDINKYLIIMPLSIFLSLLCPLGDICASAIKRASEIKDFSNIIPGHGGLVDRLDSILYTVTFTVFYFNIIEIFFL